MGLVLCMVHSVLLLFAIGNRMIWKPTAVDQLPYFGSHELVASP